MNDKDTERIATSLTQAGDLLDAHGRTVLQLVDEWQTGPRSPNLEPSRATRYELVPMLNEAGEWVEISVEIPGYDVTGESVLHLDPAATRQEIHQILSRLSKDSTRLRNLIAAIVPQVARDLAEPADWCSNHLRIGVCEPRHRGDLCRHCYDFNLAERTLPPAMLLGMWSRGERVSSDHVKRALSTERQRTQFTQEVSSAIRKARPERKVIAPQPRPPEQPTETRDEAVARKREEAIDRIRKAG